MTKGLSGCLHVRPRAEFFAAKRIMSAAGLSDELEFCVLYFVFSVQLGL
jgi:hypothetical protein